MSAGGGTGCDRNHRESRQAAALVTKGFIVFPENHTRGLAKGLAVSVSLALLAAVLISVAAIPVLGTDRLVQSRRSVIGSKPAGFHFHYIFVT